MQIAIRLHRQPETFKSSDIVLVYSFNEKNVMTPFHMRVVGFTATGVEVSYLETSKRIAIPISYIMARLLKVVAFGEPLWRELIYELTSSLQSMVDKVSKSTDYPERGKQLTELKRRLALAQKIS